jgi:hypothetical protein
MNFKLHTILSRVVNLMLSCPGSDIPLSIVCMLYSLPVCKAVAIKVVRWMQCCYSLTVPNLYAKFYHSYVCTGKKHSIYRVLYYPWFLATTGS